MKSMNWNGWIDQPIRNRAISLLSFLAITTVGWMAALVLRFDGAVPADVARRAWEVLPWLLAIRLLAAHRFRLDRGYWRHVGFRDLLRLAGAVALGSLAFPALLALLDRLHGIPASIFLLEGLLTLAVASGLRVVARWTHERTRVTAGPRGRRTFIIGAGETGEQLLRQILHDPRHELEVVGLIDDDPAKQDRSLHSIPVVGTTAQLRGLVAYHRVSLAVIAIPSADTSVLRRLVDRCVEADVTVKLVPPTIRDLVAANVTMSQVREVQIEDLLGREPVSLDLTDVGPDLAGKVVAVTGAGGSIGSELARQIMRFHPLRLILIDRAESPLHAIQLEVAAAGADTQVIPVLASVTNAERLTRVFTTYRPDCVFHAAAYKHVPMLEWNVVEAVWNNVIGVVRVARIAAACGARKFVLISTDKAVNPTSVLGVTKLLAERVVLELPSLQSGGTDFRVVRFGNVLDSDGSVVPLFRRQLARGGPLTVTHPEMRRYFMTIPEAVQLVLQAAALPEAGGRIALLEMGAQVRILDLAEQIILLAGRVPYTDVDIVFTGLRPGEKLEEELVGPAETAVPTTVDKIRMVERNGHEGHRLARQLRHLTDVTARGDEAAILRALASLVPEYHPPVPVPSLNGRVNGNGNHAPHRPPRQRQSPARLRFVSRTSASSEVTHDGT